MVKIDIKSAVREEMEKIDDAKATGANTKKIIVQAYLLKQPKEDLDDYFKQYGPVEEIRYHHRPLKLESLVDLDL